MNVERSRVVALLRSRGLDNRADWAERTLPEMIDTVANAALLRTLDIAVDSLAPVAEPAPESGPAEPAG